MLELLLSLKFFLLISHTRYDSYYITVIFSNQSKLSAEQRDKCHLAFYKRRGFTILCTISVRLMRDELWTII